MNKIFDTMIRLYGSPIEKPWNRKLRNTKLCLKLNIEMKPSVLVACRQMSDVKDPDIAFTKFPCFEQGKINAFCYRDAMIF